MLQAGEHENDSKVNQVLESVLLAFDYRGGFSSADKQTVSFFLP